MEEQVSAYPLQWPRQRKRTSRPHPSKFKVTLAAAISNVQNSLRLFAEDSRIKVESIVISSNVSLGNNRPADPGVAIWYIWDGDWRCIPVDRYAKVEDNLQAIHHCIEADRVKLRHCGIEMVRADYMGRLALPDLRDQSSDPFWWRKALGYKGDDLAECKKIYLSLMRESHPDAGGNHEQAALLNMAMDAATDFFQHKTTGQAH